MLPPPGGSSVCQGRFCEASPEALDRRFPSDVGGHSVDHLRTVEREVMSVVAMEAPGLRVEFLPELLLNGEPCLVDVGVDFWVAVEGHAPHAGVVVAAVDRGNKTRVGIHSLGRAGLEVDVAWDGASGPVLA